MKIKPFLYLHRGDRRAVSALLVFACIALLLVYVLSGTLYDGGNAIHDVGDSLRQQGKNTMYKAESEAYAIDEMGQKELFSFDPNTADSTQLLRLGLASWQVRSIYRYRAKGGVFRQPSDFARIYGLTRKQYRELLPYIHISEEFLPAAELYGTVYAGEKVQKAPFHRDSIRQIYTNYVPKIKPGQTISLNDADTTALKTVPGIGSGYARAIVAYRQRLGGFYHLKQLLEIDGLPESALSFFTISSENIRTFNINKASLSQLRSHPYLNFYQSRDILDYRRLHGPLSDINQLEGSPNFPPAELERLRPYVRYR